MIFNFFESKIASVLVGLKVTNQVAPYRAFFLISKFK